MGFLKGSVGIFAWMVLLTMGGAALVMLTTGDVGQALIFGVVAFGAWKALEAVAVE